MDKSIILYLYLVSISPGQVYLSLLYPNILLQELRATMKTGVIYEYLKSAY